MGRFKFSKDPFGKPRKRNLKKNISKKWKAKRNEYFEMYNKKNESWFNQKEKEWDEIDSASRRKIVLPEEDIESDLCEISGEDSESEEEPDEDNTE